MRVDLRALAAAAAHDPAQALLDAAGDLSDYEVFHNLVLVATYVPPNRMFKGPDGKLVEFHTTDNNLAENRFQGKAHLVLAVGPLAFSDDTAAKFGGVNIKKGDWVWLRPSDGFEMFIRDRRESDKGLSCRVIEDTFVRGRVTDPSLIY